MSLISEAIVHRNESVFHIFEFSLQQKSMTKTGENVSIALHHGENGEHQLYRLKCGTLLRVVPGPSLLGRNVALYCNYPVTGA